MENKNIITIVVVVALLGLGVWVFKSNSSVANVFKTYDADGYDAQGFDRAGYNRTTGRTKDGYDKAGFDKSGYNTDGYNKNGINKVGYDANGFDVSGYDKTGKDKNGLKAIDIMIQSLSPEQKQYVSDIATAAKNDLTLTRTRKHDPIILQAILDLMDAELLYFLTYAYPAIDKDHSFSEKMNNQSDGWIAVRSGWTKTQALDLVKKVNVRIIALQ